jgi:hypothetical protein
MRWDHLFADLDAQLAQADAKDLAGEVADRTRREAGALHLADRLRACVGDPLAVTASGAGTVHGRLTDIGPDWLLLAEGSGRELLLSARSVLGVVGIGASSGAPGAQGELARRLDLRWALRALVRSRAPVHVVLTDATVLSGTLDRVGADHVDLAEHAPGEERRADAVSRVRVLPLHAVSAVRSGG